MTKDRLCQYRALLREQQQIREQIDAVESRLYSPRSPRLTGLPGGSGGGDDDVTLALMEKHAELLEKYTGALLQIETEAQEIEKAIENLDPRARVLFRYRYLQGLKWEEICVRMSYSWQAVHKIHKAALKELSEQD